MEQIWHIFKKDVRRFWPQVLATLILLAWVSLLEIQRPDATLPPAEGWLNLLLPFAWLYLMGLLIVEDPLVGDRQFWVTTPCPWRSLFGAKALFALAFVHLPFFMSCAAILWARGFDLLPYMPYLLWKQLLLFVMLTLPATAVAALVRNATQFVLAAVLILAGLILTVNVAISGFNYSSGISGNNAAALLVVTLGAVPVIFLQFARRRTAAALSIAVAATLAAATILIGMPRTTAAAIQCGLWRAESASRPGVSQDSSRQIADLPKKPVLYSSNAGTVAFPLRFAGNPADTTTRRFLLSFEIDGPGGARYAANFSRPTVSRNPRIEAFLFPNSQNETPEWLAVRMDPALLDRLQHASVTVKGEMQFDYARRGAPVDIAIGAHADLPGWGKCSTAIGPQRYGFGEELSVNCERPQLVPTSTPVKLKREDTGEQWIRNVTYARNFGGAPTLDWLSPVDHRDAYFQFMTGDSAGSQAYQYTPPRAAADKGKIVVTPEFPAGSAIAQFEFSNVRLADFVVPPPSK